VIHRSIHVASVAQADASRNQHAAVGAQSLSLCCG
jgi:hypothetical protein